MPRCSLSWLSACMLASLRTPPFSLPPSPSLDTYVPAQARLRRNRVNACKTRATQNRHGRRNHGCLTCRATSRRLFFQRARPCERAIGFFLFSLFPFIFFFFFSRNLIYLFLPILFFSQGNRARNETRRDETRRNTFDDESVYRTNHLAPFPASTSLFSPI